MGGESAQSDGERRSLDAETKGMMDERRRLLAQKEEVSLANRAKKTLRPASLEKMRCVQVQRMLAMRDQHTSTWCAPCPLV